MRFIRSMQLAATLVLASTCAFCAISRAADPPPKVKADDMRFFEERIRPVLADRCFDCHGEDKQKGKLRLDSIAAILQGGERGPALVRGDPAASLIVHAISHSEELAMPPKKKLPYEQINDLTKWIKQGAPWPDAPAAAAPPVKQPGEAEAPFTKEQREFWAFRKPIKPALPQVRDKRWPRSPIDYFVLAKLETAGLAPAPPANPRVLIRRAYFDLLGLPPTPQEVEDFVKACEAEEKREPRSAGAKQGDSEPSTLNPEPYTLLIDRLLASPRYGERWGRHWLDVARYADSNGMDENIAFPFIYRYRDYVIAAFNADLPYDQFIREQLAGDLMPDSDQRVTDDRVVATGFLTVGPKMLACDDQRKMEMDIVDDQVSTTFSAFLGLTISCARCHDHKYDPLPAADYYALAGIFKSTRTMEHFKVVAPMNVRLLGGPAAMEREKTLRKQTDELRQQVKKKDLAKDEKKKLEEQLATAERELRELPRAMAVSEGKPQDLRVHLRGNYLTLGATVPRRFPRILAGDDQKPIGGSGSGRLELARWMTQPDHPLTARVMVNRLWRWHFGRGIVASVDNFGMLGAAPTHPQLLDWLATRFVEDNWSIKAMHRQIMLSSSYQMAATHSSAAAAVDPDNALLWRFNRRRMQAEEVRDALLAVSGRLSDARGGSLMQHKQHEYAKNGDNNVHYDKSLLRTVYLPVMRSGLHDAMIAFDFADPSVSNGDRAATTVAPQALYMMNSDLLMKSAEALAVDLIKPAAAGAADIDDAARIVLLHQRALGRKPTELELKERGEFLQRYEAALAARQPDAKLRRTAAWTALCRVILASTEFVYVE